MGARYREVTINICIGDEWVRPCSSLLHRTSRWSARRCHVITWCPLPGSGRWGVMGGVGWWRWTRSPRYYLYAEHCLCVDQVAGQQSRVATGLYWLTRFVRRTWLYARGGTGCGLVYWRPTPPDLHLHRYDARSLRLPPPPHTTAFPESKSFLHYMCFLIE